MFIPPIAYAFVAAVAFSGLNASVGYLTNILDIPVAQVILIRNVSQEPSSRTSRATRRVTISDLQSHSSFSWRSVILRFIMWHTPH